MSDDVYRRLQQHLDRMPVPFPATASGVEIRILKHLFAPDDARVALALSMIPEPVSAIARRLPRDTRDDLAKQLKRMAGAGLIQGIPGPRGPVYGKSVFVVGFYEAQVNRLTPEFERDVLQYLDEAFGGALQSLRTQQMRVVPVNQVIPLPDRAVARYDDIGAIVRTSKGPFAVMNCICQQGKDVLEKPCHQTSDREHCLTLGPAATMMVARANARFVTREEMLALLEKADREGLVLQPQNTENPLFVCCCCGCCCAVLTTAKKLPEPAAFFGSNYFAVIDAESCQACGTCLARCQMDALSLDDDSAAATAGSTRAVVDLTRCIGCGLCVTTCPSEAIHLAAHPTDRVPPKDTGRLYMQMFRDRFGTTGVATTVARRALGMKT